MMKTDTFLQKKSIPALLAIAAVSAVIIIILLLARKDSPAPANIIDRKYHITREDYWKSMKSDGRFDAHSIGLYFTGEAANRHTLDFFSYLQGRFRGMDYGDHMRAVREYLNENIRPPERADEMYELYEKYGEYQKELYLDQKSWAQGGTPEEMLGNLQRMQEFRRQRFGLDAADAIFGVEVKSTEYALRKQVIIGGTGMSGKEKEERLASLRREMWGDEGDTIDSLQDPRDRYLEKLKINEADLAAMSEEERERRLSEIRREILGPEEAERMDNADRQLKNLKGKDIEYGRLSRAILDSPDLSEAEKNRKIRELHDRLYGGPGKTPQKTD